MAESYYVSVHLFPDSGLRRSRRDLSEESNSPLSPSSGNGNENSNQTALAEVAGGRRKGNVRSKVSFRRIPKEVSKAFLLAKSARNESAFRVTSLSPFPSKGYLWEGGIACNS